jgi:hypothetical protein
LHRASLVCQGLWRRCGLARPFPDSNAAVSAAWNRIIRYFSASTDASWRDSIGTLDESFVFDDGEQHKRVWTLKPSADNHYIATTAAMQSPICSP